MTQLSQHVLDSLISKANLLSLEEFTSLLAAGANPHRVVDVIQNHEGGSSRSSYVPLLTSMIRRYFSGQIGIEYIKALVERVDPDYRYPAYTEQRYVNPYSGIFFANFKKNQVQQIPVVHQLLKASGFNVDCCLPGTSDLVYSMLKTQIPQLVRSPVDSLIGFEAQLKLLKSELTVERLYEIANYCPSPQTDINLPGYPGKIKANSMLDEYMAIYSNSNDSNVKYAYQWIMLRIASIGGDIYAPGGSGQSVYDRAKPDLREALLSHRQHFLALSSACGMQDAGIANHKTKPTRSNRL